MANETVYFIRLGKTNYYKIGFTRNVAVRLEKIDDNMPEPVELLATYCSPVASEIESQLQHKYAHKHTYREWFRLTRAEANAIVAGLHVMGHNPELILQN